MTATLPGDLTALPQHSVDPVDLSPAPASKLIPDKPRQTPTNPDKWGPGAALHRSARLGQSHLEPHRQPRCRGFCA